MKKILLNLYVFLFARKIFERPNQVLYRLSLAGLGVLNYKTSKVSGEKVFLETYLKGKKGIVIDVGANQGDYCHEVLKANNEMTIYAFEPHPLTFKSLQAKTQKLKNVALINKGMSNENRLLNLYDYADNDGSEHASLFKEVIDEIHGSKSVSFHEVELVTLDKFIDESNINHIELLKIDTEGNELQVLRGGASSLRQRKIKAIHFEFNEMNVASRAFFRDFWNILGDYRLYRLLPNEMIEIKKYKPLWCEIYAYQNIVAILKD